MVKARVTEIQRAGSIKRRRFTQRELVERSLLCVPDERTARPTIERDWAPAYR